MSRRHFTLGRSFEVFGLACALTAALPPPSIAAEKSLLILSEGVPVGIDEDGPAISHQASQGAIVNLGEPLVQYEIKGANEFGALVYDFDKFKGALAESWTFDRDALTWTFKLRHGVKSCLGNELTADDVLYTLARAKSLTGSPGGFTTLAVASLKNFTPDLYAKTPEAIEKRKLGDEVTKLDDYTVQFKQSAPNKLFLPALTNLGTYIVDSTDMKKHATSEDPWSHTYANTVNFPSYGAYCLETWQKDQEFSARANAGYWGGKPDIDRIVIRKVPQSSNRIAVLRTGGAQIVDGLNPKELDSLRTAKGVKLVGGYLNATTFMIMNFKVKPFDNPKLREAIAYAIPYDDIIKYDYLEQATQWRGLVPSAYPSFRKPTTEYAYDPAKAKQLLSEAGYPDGKGLEAFADSFKLSYAVEREAVLGPVVTQLRSRLLELGIPVQLDPLPAAQMSGRLIVQKDLPFGIWDQTKPYVVDAAFAIQLWYLSPPRGLLNMINYSNPSVDKLLEASKVESDGTKRSALLGDAQDILMKDIPYVPLVEGKLQFAVQDGVSGVVLQSSQQLSWKFLKR